MAAVRATPPVEDREGEGLPRLAAALLEASPRVWAVGAGHARADARGWERRGGEGALARRLLGAAEAAGFVEVRVGVAGTAIVADAAAAVAEPGRPLRVPPGGGRAFLADLPLETLPLSGELLATLRTLGLRRVGELAARDRAELEARFGPEGVEAHRRARGGDARRSAPLVPEEVWGASLELSPPVTRVEPLLFVLRRLLARMCGRLADRGHRAALLALEARAGEARPSIRIAPGRPTAREDLLFELCRAALEREAGGAGRAGWGSPVSGLALRVPRTAPAEVRQADLFAAPARDPLAADAALSRLRARLGPGAVLWPAAASGHRPEARNLWRPVGPVGPVEPVGPVGEEVGGERPPGAGETGAVRPASVLRLLPHPRPVRVRTADGRPTLLRDALGRHPVALAEGPERLSGGWWGEAFRREYYRVCTASGELLWIFREVGGEREGWWLHGWWD